MRQDGPLAQLAPLTLNEPFELTLDPLRVAATVAGEGYRAPSPLRVLGELLDRDGSRELTDGVDQPAVSLVLEKIRSVGAQLEVLRADRVRQAARLLEGKADVDPAGLLSVRQRDADVERVS